MADKFTSITRESDTEDKYNREAWANRAADGAEVRANKLNRNNKFSFFQTHEDYLRGQTAEAENGGQPPEWVGADLTSFIAPEIQEAMNDVKDTADQVIAYAEVVTSVARLISQVAKLAANPLETTINEIRNEIKSILDDLLGGGGLYFLPIPPNPEGGGGIDYYKKAFFDSLTDKKDSRRPLISKTGQAHALFIVLGAPSPTVIGKKFDEFLNFFSSPDKKSTESLALKTKMPEPSDFSVTTSYMPVFKPPFTQDTLYKNASTADGGVDYLRRFEGHLSLAEKASRLQGHCTWDIPFAVEREITGTDHTETGIGTYRQLNYFESKKSTENIYRQEELIITSYVLIRSAGKNEIDNEAVLAKAALEALKKDTDIKGDSAEGRKLGLGKQTEVWIGKVIPGFHRYHDTDIKAPEELTIEEVIDATGNKIPEGPVTANNITKNYFYRMAFAGTRREKRLKYKKASGQDNYEVYVSKSSYEKTAKRVTPYDDTPDFTLTVDGLDELEPEDLFSIWGKRTDSPAWKAEPVYVYNDDTDSYWELSDFTPVETITNKTVKAPDAAPLPNWYSMQFKELVPPLQALIDLAKRFVDQVADSLIESLNAIVEWIDALVAEVEYWANIITQLMELIKSLLFPPMAGAHMLTISTNRGIEGLKTQFNRSFANAPRSSTGENDYPDVFLRHGRRVLLNDQVVDSFSYDESANVLTKASGLNSKRVSEPSDEDMRRMGIPIYDSNHATMGFVFVFESITIFQAFIRLLNLNEFISEASEKAKKEIVGLREFDRVIKAALVYHKPKSRNEKLKERLAALAAADRINDNEAMYQEAEHKMGITPNNEDDEEGNEDADVDVDGNRNVIGEAEEPFEFDELPATMTFIVNGISVNLLIQESPISAKKLADIINAAYFEKLKKYLKSQGLSDDEIDQLLSSLSGLVSVVDGKLVMTTPPNTFGDKSQTVKIGASSYPFDEVLKPGAEFAGLDAEKETATLENTFPSRNGDLLVQVEDYGVPTLDMLRSVPAIFELNPFISDPDIQDFGPDKHKLLIKVDGLSEQSVDVTGNAGGNPNDAPPAFVLGRIGGGDLTFPIELPPDKTKFNLEINGDFVRAVNITGCSVSNFVDVTKAGYDFYAAGVRAGDKAYLLFDGGSTFNSTIDVVSEDTITLVNNFIPSASGVTIERIVRGSLPPSLNNDNTPKFSNEITLKNTSEVPLEIATLDELLNLMQSAFTEAGLDENTVRLSSIDTSAEEDGTQGQIKFTLGEWGIGTDTYLKISAPSYVGSSAGIETGDLSSYFPLLIDKAKRKFRIEVFGTDEAPVGFKEIYLDEGLYTYNQFVTAVQNKLDSVGLDDIKVEKTQDGHLVIFINSNSEPVHWSYSDRVGLTIKAMVPMGDDTNPSNFEDGTAQPPILETPDISFPFVVMDEYQDKLWFSAVPVITDYPSGLTAVKIPNGTYANASQLAGAISDGLNLAGFPSGSFFSYYLNNKIKIALAPNSNYVGSSASAEINNGRSTPATLTGPVIAFSEMRDYSYYKIFLWLNANTPSSTQPAPGFPGTPGDPYTDIPPAFLASNYSATAGPTVYDGTWDIYEDVNDRFQMRLTSHDPLVSGDWEEIVIAAGNYANMAAIVTAVQNSINAIYGSGLFTVSTIGSVTGAEQLQIEVTNSDYFGAWVKLETKAVTDVEFVAFGAQTPGALSRSDSGGGDVRFMEAISMVDSASYGSDDLFTHLGIMNGVTEEDAEGVKYIKAYGGSDYNFLGFINAPNYQAYGTYKIPYTLQEVIENINAHFAAVDFGYRSVASEYLDNDRLRITGVVSGNTGFIGIKAYDDGEPGSAESSAVGELLFGYREPRDAHVMLYGIGIKVTTRQLEVVVEDAGEDLDFIIDLDHERLETTVEDVEDLEIELYEADQLEQIIELEKLDT